MYESWAGPKKGGYQHDDPHYEVSDRAEEHDEDAEYLMARSRARAYAHDEAPEPPHMEAERGDELVPSFHDGGVDDDDGSVC